MSFVSIQRRPPFDGREVEIERGTPGFPRFAHSRGGVRGWGIMCDPWMELVLSFFKCVKNAEKKKRRTCRSMT